MKAAITIVHLYAKEMNIYGDNGNVQVLQKRLEWRGFTVSVVRVGVGDSIPKKAHIIIGGGGQDAAQLRIADDLRIKGEQLRTHADSGTPMLMICGMYQMFGKRFITSDDKVVEGIGILDVHTEGSKERLIGNVRSTTEHGVLVGYENHSGRTVLGPTAIPFGSVPAGQGNNGSDGTEGVRLNNVFGSYLHGPMLAKSPEFADHLVRLALDAAGLKQSVATIDDTLEHSAALVAQNRPR